MAKNTKNAKLPDIATIIQAGIDPKTGLPIKLGSLDGGPKEELKQFIRNIDKQDAANRYTWYNIPANVSSQELERMLYYKGQLAFFYIEELDQFFFMPYALDGTIDFYGRFNTIHPVPFGGGSTDDKNTKKQADYLSQMRLNCVYGIKDPETLVYDDIIKSAVLLHDYTKDLGEVIIPRQVLNMKLVDMEAETLSFMRTALIAGTGILGVRVNDADQWNSVKEGSKSTHEAALSGQMYVPMIGNLDFQELSGSPIAKAEEFLLSTQAIDNLRLSGYGIDNGGLFQKKAHILQSEANMADPSVNLIFADGLAIRQNFCNIVNSIWNLGIWVEPSDAVSAVDQNGDGQAYDQNIGGQHSGVESGGPTESNGEDNGE